MNNALREKLEREQHAFDTDVAWQRFEPTLEQPRRRFGGWWFFGAIALAFFMGAATVYVLFVPPIQSEVVTVDHNATVDQKIKADRVSVSALVNQAESREVEASEVITVEQTFKKTQPLVAGQKNKLSGRVSGPNNKSKDLRISIDLNSSTVGLGPNGLARSVSLSAKTPLATDGKAKSILGLGLREKEKLEDNFRPALVSIDQLSLKPFSFLSDLPNLQRLSPSSRVQNVSSNWRVYALGGLGYELLRAELPSEEVMLEGITTLETTYFELGVSKAMAKHWSLTGLLMTSQRNEEFSFQSTQTDQQLFYNPEYRFINGVAQGDSSLAEVTTTRTIRHTNKLNRLDAGALVEYQVPTRICSLSVYGGLLQTFQSGWRGKRRSRALSSELTITQEDLYQSVQPTRIILGTRSSSSIGRHLNLLIDANVVLGNRYTLQGEVSEANFTQKGTAFNVRMGLGYQF